MRPDVADIETAELKIKYKDGSERRYEWITDVYPVAIFILKDAGFPKAESGMVTIRFSRWPAMSYSAPAPGGYT